MSEKIRQIRQEHPEWSALSDSGIAEMTYRRHYSDLPKEQVFRALGVKLEAPKGAAPAERPLFSLSQGSALNDYVTEGVNAAAGGVSSAANFIVPGNRVSKAIDQFVEDSQANFTDVARQGKQQLASDLESADGFGEEAAAALKYVAQNPGLALSQAVGSFAGPGAAIKGARMTASGLGLTAKGVARAGLGAGAATGGAMAGGDAAGAAYDLVIKAGGTPEQAEAAAREASMLPAAIGAAGGLVGAERVFAGAKGFAGNAASRALKTGAVEGLQEGIEEGVTQYEGQRAAMPYDPSIDPMKGVGGAATLGAALGAATGAGVSALEGPPRLPNNGPLSRGANLALDRMDVEAAQAGQPAPGLSEGQYNQAMDGIMAQGDADMKALKQAGFMDKGPSAYANAAGAPAIGLPGVDPLAQSEQPFDALADRIMATRETLADEGNRQAIREKFGQSALDEVLYYLNQADKPGQIPDQTRDNMLAMAEEIVSRSRLTPMGQPGGLGAGGYSAPERLGADVGVPQIGFDTKQTGVFRADAAGNVAPETNADRINTKQATSAKKERTQGGPGMEAMTPRDTMRGAGPGVMVGEGVLTPAERPARQQPAAGPVPRLVYRPNGEPFKNQRAAVLEQRRVGGDVVPVEGGWAVQTQGEADDVRSGETVGSSERTGADGAPDAVRSLGSDGRSPADGGVAVDERGGTSAGRDGAGVGRAGAVPDGSADRGIGEALKGKTPAFLKTKTVPEMTDEELKQAQAFYGPNHKRAKTIEKEMDKRAPKAPATAEPKALPPPDEFEHAGLKIRPSRVKVGEEVKSRWIVQSPENAEREARGERQIGGDRIVDSRDEAIQTATQEVKRFNDERERNAERDREEKSRKDAEEQRKANNRGKTIAERRADAVLDKQTSFPASAGLGTSTKRQSIEMAVEQGRAIVAAQVPDTAAKNRDKATIEKVRRAGYMLGLSNENIPLVKDGLAARDRLKADDYTATEYRVYSGSDRNGSFWEITKTEYDYAQSLIAKAGQTQPDASQAQAGPGEPAAKSKADILPDDWDESTNGFTKRPVYRFAQDVGQPFAVVTQVEGMKYEVQIRHGDKQLAEFNRTAALMEVLPEAREKLRELTDQAIHQDPGQAPESATASVVGDSLKKAARNEESTPGEMRKWLLSEIEKKLLAAPDREFFDSVVKTMGEKDAISSFTGNGLLGKDAAVDYVTFDVPGDGKFKVRNSMRGLLEFKKKVSASPGFKDSGQKTVQPPSGNSLFGGSKMDAVLNMIEEGDFEAARDYAESVGISLDDVKVPKGDQKPKWEQFRKTGAVAEQATPTDSADQGQASAQATEQQDYAQGTQPEPEAAATGAKETPQVSEAEARKRLTWRDLGQSGGEKTWGLYYDDGDGRGMRYGTVSKFAGSRWSVDGHDGGRYEGLQPAKNKAEDLAIDRLRRDGYVTSPEPDAGQASPFAAFDAVAKEYGYTVAADGLIGKGGKFPGPKIVLKSGRLRIEGSEGNLLASYAGQNPVSIGKFLESFWYAEKKARASEAPVQQEGSQGEAKNDRDTFTLERLNNETGRMEPIAFERGEYVKVWINNSSADFGEIDGISQAKREFSVNGVWHTMGAAYKAERPVAQAKKTEPLSKTIETMNAKSGEGLTDADRVPEGKPASKTPTVDRHMDVMEAVRNGSGSLAEYQASFAAVSANEDAVKAELTAKTKEELLRAGGAYFHMRYKGETKPDIITAFYAELLEEYALGKSYGPNSYIMTGGGMAAHRQRKREALKVLVEGQTQEDLDNFAKEIAARRAENKAEREAKQAAMANPQTLGDFRSLLNVKIREGMTRAEAFLTLTPEQRVKYDELEAESTKESREAAKRAAKTAVRSAGQTTAGEIVATKHTRDGHDLWVVKLADRLSTDDYRTVLASAKRLGGSYSSYRGNGAIPGFQFRSPEAAQAFLKLAGGDTAEAQGLAEQRRDAFDDDRSQSAVERLREMADKLEERAQEALDRDRKTNTARRARFAAAADREAQEAKALAQTMRNIAKAIEEGRAKFLDGVRTRSQVELLRGRVVAAKQEELRVKHPSYADQEKRKGEPATAETADFAEFPTFSAFRSDLASLARQMLEVDGTKKLGQQLMSVADDVTDAYIEFAKKPENLYKLSTFSLRQGDDVKAAIFPSKDAAERAIRRSGLADRAIVLAEKRGVNRIIMSPSEAMSRGVWTGDGDKRITLTADAGAALVQAIGRRGNKTNRLTVPWQFQTAYDRLNALKRIGIETPSEYRSALREFIGLQERAVVNKVREMELAMAGRKNDGLDFFPTPAEVADQMVAAADITPDMAVLEPSAGMGHIADRIREAGAEPDVIELADDRRELLQEKGYHLADQRDFLDMKPRQFFTFGDVFRAPDGTEGILRGQGGMASSRARLVSEDGAELGKFDRDELVGVRHRGVGSGYDRIIMNPPFSNGRDIEHVMHAYDLLKPGGRIVAIMGESAFFNQSKKAEAFRQWLDDKGGTSEKLPAGSFMDPSLPVNTGVSARMVVIDKADSAGSASENQAEAGFSRALAQSTEEENALKALSENDDLFRLPKSDATTVEAITADNDPSIKVKKLQGIPGRTEYQFTMPNGKTARMVVRPANPYGANTYGFDYVDGETSNVLDVRPGDNPEDVDSDKEDVWIDVSLLSSGQDGARIYNIASTYAHNTGRIFIGDPAGLSDDALIRRPEQMLSSALKFGTTEHLAPHPRQITGDDRLGVPSLRWVYGDHIGNIKRLIDVNLKVAENAGLDEITFDPTDGSFRDSEGGNLGREGIQALAMGAGYGRAARAGADTLARGAVLRALLREGGEAVGGGDGRGRDGLLARLVSVSAAHDKATFKVFYSREGVSQTESGDGSRRQNAIAAIAHMDMVEDLVKQLTKRWKNAPEIIVLRSMDEAPAAVRAENERQIAGGATGEPEAFYHQGKAYLLASHMRSMKDVRRAVFHEVLGHLGLRELYGSEMGAILDQVARARRQDVEAKAEQYGLDMSKARDVRAAAEEWLAEKAQENPQLGFVRRAIAAIRSWLRRNVPALAEMRMTDDDIVSELIIPVQRFIKRGTSAGGLSLVPSFSRDNAADRPMFSRSAATADFTKVARESVQDFFGSAGAQVDWLDRTFKTQYAKAQKFPAFRAVFNKLQDYIEGVSTLANEAADNAPSILPKLENWRDLAKTGLKEADAKAVAAPIFEGTLSWARVRGQLVPMDEAVSQGFDGEAGVVFTDKELRDQFKLTDEQIGYYREFRAAVDESLDQLVSTEVIRLLGDAPPAVKAMAMTREGRAGLRGAISAAFENQEDPLLKQINDKFDHIDRMKARGYAPLSRFGKYWVHVIDKGGETLYFGLEESAFKANRLARTLRDEFDGATVEQGKMSQEFHKLMSAVPVDAMELFASAIGADQSEVFQKYIQLAKNNRSTMKRLIKRKGTAGFSDDVPRVLASFVTSNARAASTALNIKDAKDLARDIRDGDIKDEAIKLIESVTEPEESGAAIRGLLFVQFIGGSIASAVVNTTQPVTMTLPYLSQWGGPLKAGRRLLNAARMIATGVDEASEIGKALKRAEIEGVVSPQEIHHLIDRAAGGIGSKNLYLKKLALLWSGPFSVAEQFNRRVSFLAAYQTAKEEGIDAPFGFAEKAVIETQGMYNAGNKPNVSRGAIGATAMTFRQYSIHYLEWLARMAKSGPEGKKAAALALVLLMMAAGTDGLPFMDDMDDVFDTVGQAMGYDTNTKRARREAVASVLGEELAEVATRGFSAAAGFPVDLSVRMGMGNLLPATDLLLKSNTDTARSLAEIAGPGGAMFTQYRDAARELLGGDLTGAIQKASPVALQNLMKAVKMAETGEYRDQRDRKVTDVDGFDVGMKALSFQPAQIARESTRMSEARQSEMLAKTVENEITDKWARAIADGDREAEKEALKMRDDWNEKNPGQPIVVKRSQAVRKARNMKMERRDRFLKTVSPERRALVDQEIS